MNARQSGRLWYHFLFFLLFFCALFLFPSGTKAADNYWIGGNGDLWNDDLKWDTGQQPQFGDNAFLTQSGFFDQTVIYQSLINPALGQVFIDGTGLGAMTLSQGQDSLLADYTTIGNTGTGTLNQSGGSFTTNTLLIGWQAGSTGTYKLSDGTLLVTGASLPETWVGYIGTGTFNQSGGTHTTGDLVLGSLNFGSGTYLLHGSAAVLDAGRIFIGRGEGGPFSTVDFPGGTGLFTQNSGTVTTNEIRIGGFFDGAFSAYGTGTYELNGGLVNVTGETTVAYTSQGHVVQTGGTFNTGALVLGSSGLFSLDNGSGGFNFFSNGIYDLQGGVLNTNGTTVGVFGLGTFNQSGSSQHNVTGDLVVGSQPALEDLPSGQVREGIYNLTSGDVVVSGNVVLGAGNNSFDTEPGAKGTFTHSGGSHTVTGDLILGQWGGYNSGTGIYELSGSSILTVDGNAVVGDYGTGTFTQNGGTHIVSGILTLGGGFIGAGGTGTYNLSDGTLTNSGPGTWTEVGGFGTGTFNQSGGSFTTNALLIGQQEGSSGTYNLSDGTLLATTGSLPQTLVGNSGTGAFNQTGGSNTTGLLDLGLQSTGIGFYTLSKGDLTSWVTTVGLFGIGTFTQDGGTHTTGSIALGEGIYNGVGGVGTYNLNDGFLTTVNAAIGGYGTGTFTLSQGVLKVQNDESVGDYGTGTFNQTGGAHSAGAVLDVGAHLGSTGTYNLSGGSLTTGETIVGNGGTGTFNQSGSSQHTVPGSFGLIVGWASGNGAYNLIDGSLTTGKTIVGLYGGTGTATFNQSGGTHTTGSLVLGQNAGSSGTYTFTGGTLNDSAIIGDAGTGVFNNIGGTHNLTGDLVLGNQATGDGTYTMNGGALTADFIQVANFGKGTFNQTGGTVTTTTALTGDLNLGQSLGSIGSYEIGGATSQLTVGRTLNLGHEGEGAFTQSGGTVNVTGDILLASNTSGTGEGAYNLKGGTLMSGNIQVGNWGQGIFDQSGGENTTTGRVIIGGGSGSTGEYNLSGASTVTLNAADSAFGVIVGESGTGKFKQAGGTLAITNDLVLARFVGSKGDYLLEASSLNVGRTAYIGVRDQGTFTQTGGANTVNSSLYLGYNSTATGTYSISGGSLTAPNFYVGYNGTGTLHITGPSANITVSTLLSIGTNGSLSALPGSTIHMTGSNFENKSTTESNLAGLSNLTLIYDNQSPGTTDSFEIAGTDMGRSLAGFTSNFALGGLELDNNALLQLIDSYDNGNRNGPGGASEALYFDSLTLLPGSTLDLNNKHLYVADLDLQGGSILNGSLISLSPGDANGNWAVDSADLALWQQNYDPLGKSPHTFAQGDWNGDGRVDSADLALWQQNYNPLGLGSFSSSLPSSETVPEPATLLLLGSGLLGLTAFRRRR